MLPSRKLVLLQPKAWDQLIALFVLLAFFGHVPTFFYTEEASTVFQYLNVHTRVYKATMNGFRGHAVRVRKNRGMGQCFCISWAPSSLPALPSFSSSGAFPFEVVLPSDLPSSSHAELETCPHACPSHTDSSSAGVNVTLHFSLQSDDTPLQDESFPNAQRSYPPEAASCHEDDSASAPTYDDSSQLQIEEDLYPPFMPVVTRAIFLDGQGCLGVRQYPSLTRASIWQDFYRGWGFVPRYVCNVLHVPRFLFGKHILCYLDGDCLSGEEAYYVGHGSFFYLAFAQGDLELLIWSARFSWSFTSSQDETFFPERDDNRRGLTAGAELSQADFGKLVQKIKSLSLGFQPAQIRAVLLADSKTCTKLSKGLEANATKDSFLAAAKRLGLTPKLAASPSSATEPAPPPAAEEEEAWQTVSRKSSPKAKPIA